MLRLFHTLCQEVRFWKIQGILLHQPVKALVMAGCFLKEQFPTGFVLYYYLIPGTNEIGITLLNFDRHELASVHIQNILRISASP